MDPDALLNMTVLAGAHLWCGRVLAWRKRICFSFKNCPMTASGYVHEILDVYVRPYAGDIGFDFILMDDNARPHRARVTNDQLHTSTIERTTVQELQKAILDEWARIPQQSIRRLIRGMRRQCLPVIQSDGHHTRY